MEICTTLSALVSNIMILFSLLFSNHISHVQLQEQCSIFVNLVIFSCIYMLLFYSLHFFALSKLYFHGAEKVVKKVNYST